MVTSFWYLSNIEYILGYLNEPKDVEGGTGIPFTSSVRKRDAYLPCVFIH